MAKASLAGLKNEVEVAVLADTDRMGTVDRAAIVKRFLDRGASRSTLLNWINAVLASGKPAARLQKKAESNAARRARENGGEYPAEKVAERAVAALPHLDLSSPKAVEGIPFMKRLMELLANSDRLRQHAEHDGSIRNAKLFLQSSEHLRRSLATAARIQETVNQNERVDRFMEAMFEILKEEAPVTAEKVVIRLRQLRERVGAGSL